MKGLELRRDIVIQHAGNEAGNAVDHNHGRQLSAGQNVVADGQVIRGHQLQGTLIHALVMAAQKYQFLLGCQLFCDFLAEDSALRGQINHPGLLSDSVTQVVIGITDGHRLHHHARAAAVRIIVHMTVLVRRVFPDVYGFDRNQAILYSSADDAGVKAV